ncbi:peptide deformylase [Helicobacter sp. MIT 14-3879]|uniref:peptide deformylase n=1 Tax=Helicobacter sp. MIT 14-3879 TaxID=2040649 RepID=UPI000E1EDF02|nr:peptide deformylase [Helicobacter sp. MIT 14-3879]RDU65034.1 peptide deformylase [Helicobacter sp. MIT 14-3879]
MVEEIVIYPDSRLRETSKEVIEFGSVLKETLDNMYETMMDKGGVGLAGVQIGKLQRMLIVNIPREDRIQYKEDLLEIINPNIIESSGEILFQEGCLSIPNYYEYVKRFSYIKLQFQDREGKEKIIEAKDYLAVALQHEIDHLNGILFIDKLSILKRKKFEKEYKKKK